MHDMCHLLNAFTEGCLGQEALVHTTKCGITQWSCTVL